MTPNEFKAWFDGFTEAFTGCPTKAQWTRIKARVAEIDGKPVTERVYVDRYWPTYLRYYPNSPSSPYWTPYLGATSGVGVTTMTGGFAASNNALLQNASAQICSGGTAFNSMQAMNDLGRADAAALGAQ